MCCTFFDTTLCVVVARWVVNCRMFFQRSTIQSSWRVRLSDVFQHSTISPFLAIKLSNILPGFDDFGLIGTHGSTFFWFFNNCALKFIPKPADYWLGFCQELSGAQARLPTIATAKRQLHSFSKLRYRLPINYQGCRLP